MHDSNSYAVRSETPAAALLRLFVEAGVVFFQNITIVPMDESLIAGDVAETVEKAA